MKFTTGILAGASVLLLVATGPAYAEDAASTTPSPSTSEAAPATPADTAPTVTSPTTATDAVTPPATTTPSADPAAAAAPSGGDLLASVRAEGAKLDAKAGAKFESALQPVVNDVEKSATTDGDRRVAERLGAEFGITPDALLAEKSELKASWGQLMIAHALLANSTSDLSARQLFDLRNEGMTWGQIASGMGFRLGEVLSAAKTEAKVAKGLAKPDGRAAEIHGTASKVGTGARAEKRAKTASTASSKDAEVVKPAAEGSKGAAEGVKAADEGVNAAAEGVKAAGEEKK